MLCIGKDCFKFLASLCLSKTPAAELSDLTSLDMAVRKKMLVDKMIVELRRSMDDALTAAMQLDTATSKTSWQLPYYKMPVESIRRRDTVITSQKISKKRGFFQRVKKALSGVNDKDTVVVDRISATNVQQDSAEMMTGKAVRSVEEYYRKNLDRQ